MKLKRNEISFAEPTRTLRMNKKNHKFRHEMTLTARNYIKRSQNGRRKRNEKSKQTDKERKKNSHHNLIF